MIKYKLQVCNNLAYTNYERVVNIKQIKQKSCTATMRVRSKVKFYILQSDARVIKKND